MPDMKNLSKRLREVAVGFEMLRQGDRVGRAFAKVCRQVIDSKALRSKTYQKSIARRRANRLIAVGPFEQHSSFGKTIDRWGFSKWISIAPDSGFEIVDADQEHVRSLAGYNRLASQEVRTIRSEQTTASHQETREWFHLEEPFYRTMDFRISWWWTPRIPPKITFLICYAELLCEIVVQFYRCFTRARSGCLLNAVFFFV